eukprot:CAMPEP_0185801542 /NCGR_PEP_ID=MMETSP1322-20130828/1485_1 /TAXON_ID=265543 /ORGANISM="Minutocellus polymorphus, Strain RCC2270" /LENGTH=624 /DNA_ID=CAMNT_0028497241 /DNA_START=43 /DNA_END=1917 /DNA_ORIENTATION=+
MSSGGTYLPPTLTSTNDTSQGPPDLLSDPNMPSSPAPLAGSPHSSASGSPRQRYHTVSNESESSGDSDHGNDAAAASAAVANGAQNNRGAAAGAGGGEAEEDAGMSLSELMYGTSSYHAIAKPVGLTMILAALATVYINDEATLAMGEAQLAQAYTVFSVGGADQSAAQNASLSLLNALIICSVIGLMTFGIVLLYKYRCMKCLIGYMIFSSTMLLGFLGGVVFDTAVEVYRLPIDKFSFFFTLWNFAVVGTTSIFYQRGIPTKVTQGYLIMTSVILAWQLAHFNEWTAWALLIMLALYDLCAVLTPCGPLKLLVNEFQADDAPEMPGLLYEAGLPSEARRPGRSVGGGGNSRRANSSGGGGDRVGGRLRHSGGGYAMAERSGPSSSAVVSEAAAPNEERAVGASASSLSEAPSTGLVPLAIAKIYRLPFVDPDSVPRDGSGQGLLEGDEEGASPNALLSREFTPEELRMDVEVIFPRNGGRIIRQDGNERDNRTRYIVMDRHGEIKRTLLLNDQGKVFEEVERDGDDDSEDGGGKNSIKLGLGDFIFYSVLVSKAAQYSFATFIACFLVILAGLGGTLVLLSVYHQALPALPISIFLGVVFYVCTRFLIEPWIQDLLRTPFFV